MSRPLHYYELAYKGELNTRSCGRDDGLIVVYQKPNEHGPRMRFIHTAGHAFVVARELGANGAVMLALFDTIGFDWLAE